MLMFFFFNDPATTEIYTLPLHDALPICLERHPVLQGDRDRRRERVQQAAEGRALLADVGEEDLADRPVLVHARRDVALVARSEEHTSELQSRQYLVCRLLLEKKTQTHFL